MKKRLWRPSLNYSKTGLKRNSFHSTNKNRKEKILFFSFLFILCSSLILYSDPAAELNMQISEEGIYTEVSLRDVDLDVLRKNLNDGQQVEIRYEFRLYRVNTGLFNFVGDTLVQQMSHKTIGQKDLLTSCYRMKPDSDSSDCYQTEDEFFQIFLRDSDVFYYDDLKGGIHYVLCRVVLYPIKLHPPLSLLHTFNYPPGIRTEWVKSELFPVEDKNK